MLETDTTTPSPPDFDAMLGDFARQHPDMAWMTQWIASSRRAPQVEPGPDPRDEAFDAMRAELEDTRRQAAKLARLARRLSDDLDNARERLADLAANFGACGLCWGDDTHCPACRGRGAPGHFHAAAIPRPQAQPEP